MIKTTKTAGELANEALRDNTKYDVREVGESLCKDILNEIWKCIDLHHQLIDEQEFCVVMVIAGDPLIKNMKRRKFYAWPYLPSPRPNQSVFLYEKKRDEIRRLWVLPEVEAMIQFQQAQSVPSQYMTMKGWSEAFFRGCFWEYIRKQHNIDMLSESEYLESNKEKLRKAGVKESPVKVVDPFDFSKLLEPKVINSQKVQGL